MASWRTARKEISDSARRGLQRGQRDLFTMEKALRAEKEKRELDQRKKAHGELCRSLVNEVADAYSRSFPADVGACCPGRIRILPSSVDLPSSGVHHRDAVLDRHS